MVTLLLLLEETRMLSSIEFPLQWCCGEDCSSGFEPWILEVGELLWHRIEDCLVVLFSRFSEL
jgi:hypothetical protein